MCIEGDIQSDVAVLRLSGALLSREDIVPFHDGFFRTQDTVDQAVASFRMESPTLQVA